MPHPRTTHRSLYSFFSSPLIISLPPPHPPLSFFCLQQHHLKQALFYIVLRSQRGSDVLRRPSCITLKRRKNPVDRGYALSSSITITVHGLCMVYINVYKGSPGQHDHAKHLKKKYLWIFARRPAKSNSIVSWEVRAWLAAFKYNTSCGIGDRACMFLLHACTHTHPCISSLLPVVTSNRQRAVF